MRSRWARRHALVATALLVVVGLITPGSDAGASTSTSGAFSWNAPIPPIDSTYGSGHFGQWGVDGFGLPTYHYTVDQQTDPIARQAELAGGTDAWSQVGNDRVKADAFNQGYTELWSQDRLAQWINKLDASHDHMGGGFGYLNVDGKCDQHPVRRSSAVVGHPTNLRRRVLRALRIDIRCRCAGERLRTIRKRSRPRPRRHHHEHLGPRRERFVVRVLGRESLRPEPGAVPRYFGSRVIRRRPDTDGRPAAPGRGQCTTLHLLEPADAARPAPMPPPSHRSSGTGPCLVPRLCVQDRLGDSRAPVVPNGTEGSHALRPAEPASPGTGPERHASLSLRVCRAGRRLGAG